MLVKTIAYTDFRDEKKSATLRFNLSRVEMMKMEIKYKQGFVQYLKDLQDERDNQKAWDMVEDFVLMGYGELDEDGSHFVKTAEIRARFEQSAMYEALMFEILAEDGMSGIEFLIGMLPKDWMKDINVDDVKKEVAEEVAKRNPELTTTESKPPSPPNI